MNRRQFFRMTAGAFALLAARRKAYGFCDSPASGLWQTQLRGVGPGGIPVAAPDASPAPVTGVLHYTIDINQYNDQLHPNFGPTTLWGYHPANPLGGGYQPQRHLGGIIVAQKHVPLQITFRNNLPPTHILPMDTTIQGANQVQNRAATHLHGGFVPWISDGGPFDWFAPDGTHGASFLNNAVLNPNAAPNEAEYYYPNQQSARLMWYHDHAFGITRLNAYAGIATAYVLRDNFEAGLRNMGLPDFVENGGREIPLVIQDKIFVCQDVLNNDPTWPGSQNVGSLWYSHVYDAERGPNYNPSDPSCVPEFFGDTMLANGTVYPQATVEARRYRFRILNACNARFLNLQLYVDDGSPDGITLANGNPTNQKGPDFLVLGTEGGFLANPVVVPSNKPFNPVTLGGSLITGPAERWDLIIDFKGFEGKKLILYSDAPAPFPGGDSLTDFFPGLVDDPPNPVNEDTPPGFGLNTREIMRFEVVAGGTADPPLRIRPATSLVAGIDPFIIPIANILSGNFKLNKGTVKRQLTLNEAFDQFGRLIQFLGTNVAPNPLTAPADFGRAYTDAPTETSLNGSFEVWEIANLSGDTHPIHFHLVNVQILNRQPFNPNTYAGTPTFIGPPRPPDPTELGWKETVQMHPGEVTRVIMQVKLQPIKLAQGGVVRVPTSPRTGGNEYVWHCHILEHEEHDMMRPFVVI